MQDDQKQQQKRKKERNNAKKTKGVVIKDNDGLHCLRKVNQEDQRIRANGWVNSTSTEEILLFPFYRVLQHIYENGFVSAVGGGGLLH